MKQNNAKQAWIAAIKTSKTSMTKEDLEILQLIQGKKAIVLLNKMDLKPKIEEQDKRIREVTNNVIKTSVLNKEGIENLYQEIEKLFHLDEINIDNEVMITNVRHKDFIKKALENTKKTKEILEQDMPIDMIAMVMKEILENLGNITGEEVSEDIINEIFAKFCLGK